jgi:hypothetical protein
MMVTIAPLFRSRGAWAQVVVGVECARWVAVVPFSRQVAEEERWTWMQGCITPQEQEIDPMEWLEEGVV